MPDAMRPAAALQSGDLVDLAKLGPYGFDRANPDSESWRIAADCEYGVVDEVDRFVAATVQLHGPGCVNPYSGNATTPVDLIAVGDVVPAGPYWWTTPGLLNNYRPTGARIFRAEVFKQIWINPAYKARLEAHRQSELDAEASP